MRIAITGTTGRVGAALAKHFTQAHEVIELPRQSFDLADPTMMTRVLDGLACDVLLNPAGLTSVDVCEDVPELARQVNTSAPAMLAAWCARRRVRFIHFSTDYVFGGDGEGLRHEDEPTGPLGMYGRTKRDGEIAVLATDPSALVLRVSWVFGPEKPSFIDHVTVAARRGETLRAVADKWSLPTSTRDLNRWVDALLRTRASGVLHACQSGSPVSWHDLASAVVEELFAAGQLDHLPDVERQSLADMRHFRAPRPRHTAMATRRLAASIGETPREWREALHQFVRNC